MGARAGRVAAVIAVAACMAFLVTHRLVLVRGGSMMPALLPGDVCVVRRGSWPRGGDVVFFEHRCGAVLHRVVRQRPDGTLLTRGDANEIADRDPVRPSAVRGRVVGVFRTGMVLRGLERARGACATLTAQSHSFRR